MRKAMGIWRNCTKKRTIDNIYLFAYCYQVINKL